MRPDPSEAADHGICHAAPDRPERIPRDRLMAEHGDPDGGMGAIGMATSGSHDHADMIRGVRQKWLWTNFTVIALGVRLATSPATFGYLSPAMIPSDVASGALLVLFGSMSLWPSPRADFWGRWTVGFIGGWLQFAPLVFWVLADDHYALDIGRARKGLGWGPKRSLLEALPRMVSALKADPLSFYKRNKLEVPSWLEQTITPQR